MDPKEVNANASEESQEVVAEESGLPANDPNGEGTTPEEVAELLHLPSVPSAESEDESEEESDDDSEEDEATGDGGDDEGDGGGDGADEEEAEDEESDDADEEQEATGEAPQFTLEVEDANGKKFTLKPDDDIEKVLEDFEPKSNGQIFSILQKLQNLQTEKAAYEKDQEQKTAEAEKTKRISTIRAGWDAEIEKLQGDKRLPVQSDGKENPRVQEVFKYMREENERRTKDSRPLLESFEDALDKLELKESRDKAAEEAKKEKELAKKKGAVVGGSSAPASSGAPVYKGGARNGNEALRQMGILR